MAQFSGKGACQFEYPPNFIAPSAGPGEIFLVPVEPRPLSLARFCLGPHTQRPACEDHILRGNQQIIGNTDGNRFGGVDREQAAPVFPITQANIVCRSAKRAELIEKFFPGSQNIGARPEATTDRTVAAFAFASLPTVGKFASTAAFAPKARRNFTRSR